MLRSELKKGHAAGMRCQLETIQGREVPLGTSALATGE